MHNGFVQVEGEKMAKSTGNFITTGELLDKWPGDVLRLQMLMTHYRQPLDWTENQTLVVQMELEDWACALQGYYHWPNEIVPEAVIHALSDDLNTPDAITILREQFSRAKKGGSKEKLLFAAGCKLLGFRELNRPGLFQFGVSGVNAGREALFSHSDSVVRLRAGIANNISQEAKTKILDSIKRDNLDVDISNDGTITLVGSDYALTQKIEKLVNARNAARKSKNFKEADRIRDELKQLGVELEDKKDGTTIWKIAS
jgi:cysteinyl-tRNA synthetase